MLLAGRNTGRERLFRRAKRPRAHEHDAIRKATEKVTGENHTRNALRQGEPLAAAFKRFDTV